MTVVGKIFSKVLGTGKIVEKGIESGTEIIQSNNRKEQATRRHELDMLSDSKLSKSIRPMIVIWAIVVYTILIGLSVAGYTLPQEIFSTFSMILGLAVGFYFPARTIEKFIKSKNKELNSK